MWTLTGRPSSTASSLTLSHLAFTPQGPYSLCVSAVHGGSVLLWDLRRGKVAAAELHTPAGCLLSSGPQLSHDGHILYAATSHCTVSNHYIHTHTHTHIHKAPAAVICGM